MKISRKHILAVVLFIPFIVLCEWIKVKFCRSTFSGDAVISAAEILYLIYVMRIFLIDPVIDDKIDKAKKEIENG